MRKHLLTWILIGFSGIAWGQGKVCLTDPELMAEVAARYLVEQEYQAVVCAYLYKETIEPAPGMLLALVRDVGRKFQFQFTRYHKLRSERFRRLFGENWEQALALDHRNKLKKLNLETPRLEPETCEQVKKTWETMLYRDWVYLRKRMDPMAEELRTTVQMCPLQKRELPLAETLVDDPENLEDLDRAGEILD